jgi:hypothetical protein
MDPSFEGVLPYVRLTVVATPDLASHLPLPSTSEPTLSKLALGSTLIREEQLASDEHTMSAVLKLLSETESPSMCECTSLNMWLCRA